MTATVHLDPIDRTRLPAEHAEVIRQTLPLVGSKINEITPLFYQKMFAAHPELIANVFNRGNQKQGAQQRALAASIATFATMLVDDTAPAPEDLLQRIGHKHASLGITADQYQIVHDNLFAAIVEVLGAETVTPEVAAAWDAVYWLMADVLIGFERRLYRSAGVADGDVFRTVTVTDRTDLPGEVMLVTVEAKPGDDPLPGHLPGQYISVGATLPDGARQLRQYSLVDDSSPGRLTFAVKRLGPTAEAPAGEVSNFLADHVAAGDELQVTLPFGDLVLTDADAPVVLISAGIGATPMVGILEYLVANRSERTVVSLHGDLNPAVDALAVQRSQLTGALPNGQALTWYETGASDGARTGFIDLAEVELPADADVYICGSNGFLQHMRTQLTARGFADEKVHFELFAPNDWLLDG